MTKLLDERERRRAEVQPGIWQSWWYPVAFFALGLLFWALLGGLVWLIWRVL